MHWTIATASDAIQGGMLTPADLLEACFAEIERNEPKVHAWTLLDRDGARMQARIATDEIKKGYRRGPLHGIPVGIKDIVDVFDQPTAAGSRLWAQSVARQDATVVQRLRQAGAIIMGKTVTTQYASFDPPPTRNPWDISRTPGGSSSGSAVALACGMCLGALGSQTGGSLTRPASYCGVATCKPTFGRVSTRGVVPLAYSMDHVGPMARTVHGLAVLLQVIAGADPSDPGCSKRPVPDMLACLSKSARPPRLARLRGLFMDRAEPVMLQLVQDVVERLSRQGAAIRQLASPAGFSEVLDRHRTVMAVEAAWFHGQRFRSHPEDYQPRITALLNEGLACPASEYAACKRHQKDLTAAIKPCFDGMDALITPATTGPAPDAAITGDPAFNSPWSYTGLPTVSIPAGWTPEGLPIAIQLVGPPWSEANLLRTAAWCERIVDFRFP
jgi:Asp-tRNA(Asn)/Glu-tRNA(Gln) amidotransferase A subunit family amidase